MRPIFTIHAGEYLVGAEIEDAFPHLRVWVPSKDKGIDLLVTDSHYRTKATLQVKFSKDHLASGKESSATWTIQSGGWWQFKRDKLASSEADYWVLVLSDIRSRKHDYVIVKPQELARRYAAIAPEGSLIQSYFWVTQAGRCWETRSLGKADRERICTGAFVHKERDFTSFLNRWPFERHQPH